MKRKVWVVSGVFYVMAAVMLLMSAVSYQFDPVLFAVELTVSLLCLGAVVVADIGFHEHIVRAARDAKRVFGAQEGMELSSFSLPLVVVGSENDIVWANDAFVSLVSRGECRGENILRYLYPCTLRQVITENGANVEVGQRKFTVHGTVTGGGAVLYYVDNTYYKNIENEFERRHPVVLCAAFDNRDELVRDASGGEDSVLTNDVETVLRDWAIKELGGIYHKLNSSRYLILADESHVAAAASKRFEVLDAVRMIKNSQNLPATVSIGVGRGAATMAESEQWARQAMNMALGRGGDQVAVKSKGDAYEFFGGLSKGVEKRDKVRTRVIAATMSDYIKAANRVYIMGHRFSDLDSVGSAVGMWAAITKGLSKTAYVVVNRQQTLAKELIARIEDDNPGQRIFISPQEALQSVTPKSLLIVTDTHSTSVIESEELLQAVPRVIVIDHHRMMVNYIKDTLIFYHEPYASSASEMVAELVQYISANAIGPREAQAMLAGIMLDTKNYVIKTGVRTFEASAYLRRRGADTVSVKRLFADSMETYKMKSQLIVSAETYKGCAIASSDSTFGDMRIAAAQAADELLSIQGVKASFVLYKVGDGVNFSARSYGEVNVQILMEELGGGGHMTMAGAMLPNKSLLEAREWLQQVLDDKLELATASSKS